MKTQKNKTLRILLAVMAVCVLLCFCLGIKDVIVHKQQLKNAITVTATIGQTHKQTQLVKYSHSGAGDDMETEVKQISYYTHELSYSYDGENYKQGCTYSDLEKMGVTGLAEEGRQVEIKIDAGNPSEILREKASSSWFVVGGMLLLILLTVLLCAYFIRRKKNAKAS